MSDCVLGCIQQHCRRQPPVFARDTVLEVEVLLYPSLQFAHRSVDTRRPVFRSLSKETCSGRACLPRLLLALGISPPRGCSQPLGTEGEGGFRQKLNWIFRDKLGLAVAQTSTLPRIARRVWQTRGLPPPAEVQCMQASRRVARAGGSASAALRCLSFHHLKKKNPKQLTEASPRRTSFTKMNPPSVN